VIVYEYPFNELVRSMLRLEYLFARFNHFIRSDDPELHHNAISILFDLGDIGARGDIKSLLLKEFERQKYTLNGLKSSQKVDPLVAHSCGYRFSCQPYQSFDRQAKLINY